MEQSKAKIDQVVPEQTATFHIEPKSKQTGKEDYNFQKSYRRSNFCSKFLYIYGNRVVNSV